MISFAGGKWRKNLNLVNFFYFQWVCCLVEGIANVNVRKWNVVLREAAEVQRRVEAEKINKINGFHKCLPNLNILACSWNVKFCLGNCAHLVLRRPELCVWDMLWSGHHLWENIVSHFQLLPWLFPVYVDSSHRIDLPVDRTRESDTDSKEHCARRFLRGQILSSLIYHRCVIVVMMVKAPSTVPIPAFIKEAPSGFVPHRGPASWAACCYQSRLSVCSVSDVIASNTISSAGTWLNQTQHLYFPEIFILVTVWLF